MYKFKLSFISILFLMPAIVFGGESANGSESKLVLAPNPQQIEMLNSHYKAVSDEYIHFDYNGNKDVLKIGQIVKKTLHLIGQESALTAANIDNERIAVRLKIDSKLLQKSESYQLEIHPDQITIVGHDIHGLYYGVQTFKQICKQFEGKGQLPCLKISDWPDFPNRGFMLDISRNKVPKMETLYRLVNLLSEWKINQLQLYTEHTFAYSEHELVWRKASPMTAEQVLLLDDYCKERYIEFVPNQNSFGHMENWLGHTPYRYLADAPDGCQTEVGWWPAKDLNPVDPRSLEFLDGLYDELLPNFTSQYFNVGCDETFALGVGKSKEACEKEGKGRVYLNFVKEIQKLAKKHNKKIMMWGDIVLRHSELIPELPKDIIALNWGYLAEQPSDLSCKMFADADVPFYVCPGTSNWLTFVGNFENSVPNMRNAGVRGKKYGAIGYLNTEWGDGGHMHTLPISLSGVMYGALVSWCVDNNKDFDPAPALNKFVYEDRSELIGDLLVDLGYSSSISKWPICNWNIYCYLLSNPKLDIKDKSEAETKIANLKKTILKLDEIRSKLSKTDLQCDDSKLVIREISNAIALSKHCCLLGIERLNADGYETKNIPKAKRLILAKDLGNIFDEFKKLWFERNRAGGLAGGTAVAWMENMLRCYQN